MPTLNGENAKIAVRGAFILLGFLIAAMTVIVVSDNEVPSEFSAIVTALMGAIVGFLTGTRVVPPDVSAHIKGEPLNTAEIEHLAHDSDRAESHAQK